MRIVHLILAAGLVLASLVFGGNDSCLPVEPAEPVCAYGGETFAVGESFPSTDGCNTCSCMDDGMVACTLRACGCVWNGEWRDVGESFPAGDGCNTCTCSVGGVACTEMACLPDDCDPANDWWREYVATDVEQCYVIRFVCPENAAYFLNDCGCGCEQPADCPQWFNCMPGPGVPPCDTDWIHQNCPYSGIAY